ncbi:sodium:proton antiporter [Methanonatronarchaeum sp. AMET6-2]|uniref:sodium:proton antiporter n=1 Tax=Methanonatronarchaeum sp. AMET6-2 TaxID=2933293 RepID=UPI0012298CF7|nr:cation:proton antiporter subunit C [Methanonatronarchaeum sp. AMET6-2]RZN61153.1 MAG: cation:proton antiporter [Methanonatronarchaeia archaeon]UOY09788.1 cation:proton antiporter subunit C [Methanonatronarchaeum sp. AMET6-2]
MINLPYIAVALLLLIGFYGLIFRENIFKTVISVVIIASAANLFLVSTGYRADGTTPIFTLVPEEMVMVFAVPQALVITAIVIGLAITTLMLALVVKIYKEYGTLDTKEIRRLKG